MLSNFKEQSLDAAAIYKSAYRRFLINVPKSAFVVMNLGTKILTPSRTPISTSFCCSDADALLDMLNVHHTDKLRSSKSSGQNNSAHVARSVAL